MPGIFVTGTDTGVGKTVAACALIHALRAKGLRVHPFKPIAAGAVERNGACINEDTHALIVAANLDPSAAGLVTPVLLREAMAPHIAASREGTTLTLDPVRAAFDRIKDSFVVAEGVGGFLVPLSHSLDSMDLCRALGLPIVLVVGMRLGCLNHALLTAQAIAASGMPFAGWIANSVDPAMLAPDENLAALESRLDAPLLGKLPYRERPDPRELASFIDVGSFL
jgi:dethiobiotin synthetase